MSLSSRVSWGPTFPQIYDNHKISKKNSEFLDNCIGGVILFRWAFIKFSENGGVLKGFVEMCFGPQPTELGGTDIAIQGLLLF